MTALEVGELRITGLLYQLEGESGEEVGGGGEGVAGRQLLLPRAKLRSVKDQSAGDNALYAADNRLKLNIVKHAPHLRVSTSKRKTTVIILFLSKKVLYLFLLTLNVNFLDFILLNCTNFMPLCLLLIYFKIYYLKQKILRINKNFSHHISFSEESQSFSNQDRQLSLNFEPLE